MSELRYYQFVGYRDDPRNAFGKNGQAYLTTPSKNVRLTTKGEAYTRQGYEDTAINLNEAGNASQPFYMARYDLTFFACNTKVYYVEGELTPTASVYDTGLTITAGQARNTNFDEYAGQVILTNKTDGARVIMVTRLNGAVAAGAASIKGDRDGVIRTNRFNTELSITNFNLRINGVNEACNGTNTAAATFTLTGTASQAYTDNSIAIVTYDLSSRFPKCSKIVSSSSKGDCLYFLGIQEDETPFSADVAPNVIAFTPFITGASIEAMLQITGGASGMEPVGKGGEVTNLLATRDYVYIWKKNRTAYIVVSDINTTSGARPPNEFDEVEHGCINERCAVSIGADAIAFLTPDKRIIAIRTKVEDGSVVLFPDETFDRDIRNLLAKMDDDQPNAFLFYHRGKKLLYVQLNIDASIHHLVYDNNIRAWLPPDDGKAFAGMFERKGTLFATDIADDTIYQLDSSNQDLDIEINCHMAHGIIEPGVTTAWKTVEMEGSITQNSTILVHSYVDDTTPSDKYIYASNYSFAGGKSFSDIVIGDNVIGGLFSNEKLADWDERFMIAPQRYGNRYQTVLSSAGGFTWRSFSIDAKSLSHSLSTIK